MEYRFIYVTAQSEKQACQIGRAAVEERLAACANVLPGMTSFYWWGRKIEKGSESVLILKTRKSLVEKLTERICQLHSYECPCIVSLPIDGGNFSFLEWIGSETQKR